MKRNSVFYYFKLNVRLTAKPCWIPGNSKQWWSATGFFGCPKDFYWVSSTKQQEENDCDGVQGY